MSQVPEVNSSYGLNGRQEMQNRRNSRIFVITAISLIVIAIVCAVISGQSNALAIPATGVLAAKAIGISATGALILLALIGLLLRRQDESQSCSKRYRLDTELQAERGREMRDMTGEHFADQHIVQDTQGPGREAV